MYYSQPLPPPAMMAASLSQHNRPMIEVSGEGTVSAAPDRAVIVLGVITENPTLTTAQSENSTAVTNVINALLRLAIRREQIQTASYRIEIQYNYGDGTQIFRGYRVTHLLQVNIDRIEQTGLVVDTAVNIGANFVSDIQFTIANPEIFYNQALSLAIKNAESKAITIARTLGATLVRTPVKVTEQSRMIEPPPVPYQAALLTEGAAAPTPIQPGELKIIAVVKVQYIYY
ncbi:SIMPL domain-containing protein [Paenibacillus alkalitolerans]|uniref:SIMPL domain-containing protein n=1 Tax=Paenibacillus alkalitolerans TaxID=2799335 RepID=UPI0018F54A7D|nr:SIMPL domain-containing protein [Paenibacillus alkalitolerans]